MGYLVRQSRSIGSSSVALQDCAQASGSQPAPSQLPPNVRGGALANAACRLGAACLLHPLCPSSLLLGGVLLKDLRIYIRTI